MDPSSQCSPRSPCSPLPLWPPGQPWPPSGHQTFLNHSVFLIFHSCYSYIIPEQVYLEPVSLQYKLTCVTIVSYTSVYNQCRRISVYFTSMSRVLEPSIGTDAWHWCIWCHSSLDVSAVSSSSLGLTVNSSDTWSTSVVLLLELKLALGFEF